MELYDTKYKNYKVSKCGRVFSTPRNGTKGGELNQFTVRGYYRISLWVDGKCKFKQTHRLVAETFIPNPENKPQVNHIDGNKLNNHLDNLEWATQSENMKHAYRLGLVKNWNIGRNESKSPSAKKIHQYDLNGQYINSFGSLREASRKVNIPISGISMCANGQIQQSRGFIWKK